MAYSDESEWGDWLDLGKDLYDTWKQHTGDVRTSAELRYEQGRADCPNALPADRVQRAMKKAPIRDIQSLIGLIREGNEGAGPTGRQDLVDNAGQWATIFAGGEDCVNKSSTGQQIEAVAADLVNRYGDPSFSWPTFPGGDGEGGNGSGDGTTTPAGTGGKLLLTLLGTAAVAKTAGWI